MTPTPGHEAHEIDALRAKGRPKGSFKTVCKRGHVLTDESTTHLPSGQRRCRECHRLRIRAERLQKRGYLTIQDRLEQRLAVLERRAERWKEAARVYRRVLRSLGARRLRKTWFVTQVSGSTR